LKHLSTFLIILFASCWQSIEAQLAYEVNEIKYENGQSLGYTRHVLQDSLGKLWITGGRGNGFHSFDGKNIVTYHEESQKHFLQFQETYLAKEMSDNNFLLSDWTDKLYVFNPYNKTIVDTISQKQKPYRTYYDIEIDPDNRIWAISKSYKEGDFIFLYRQNNQGTMVEHAKIPINNYAQLIAYNNQIFVTADEAIYIYNLDGSLHKFCTLKDGNLVVSPYGFAIGHSNTLFLKSAHQSEEITRSKALFKYDTKKEEFEKVVFQNDQHLIDTEAIKIIGNDMWFLGVHEHLWRLNLLTKKLEDYTDRLRALSVRNFYLLDIFKDRTDQLWVTTSRGLVHLSQKKEPKFKSALQRSSEFCDDNCYIQSILATPDKIYFSFLQDLVELDKASGAFSKTSLSLPNVKKGNNMEAIWDLGAKKLSLADDMLIWNDQLINTNKNTSTDILKNQSDYRVVSEYMGDQKIWLAPYYPRNKIERLTEYNLANNTSKPIPCDFEFLADEIPYKILASKENNTVILLYEKSGIVVVNKSGKFVHQIKSRFQNFYTDVVEDSSGNFWFANKKGLSRLKPNGKKLDNFFLKKIDFRGKRSFEAMHSLVLTGQQTIWVGAASGFKRFNIEKEIFDTPNNLPDALNQFEPLYASACFEDGVVYFGTKNGVVYFEPERFESDKIRKSEFPLSINEITIYNEKDEQEIHINENLSQLSEIDLSHRDLWFELDFVLPYFESGETVLYSHKLDGFDKEWSIASLNNVVKYTNLPPGDYTLNLRAGHTANDMNKYSRKLNISVSEAWFKTLWFQILSILGIVAIVYLFQRDKYNKRLKSRLQIESLRNKISNDLHDEVGSILTGIAMQSEVLSYGKKSEEQKPLTELSEMSRLAMDRMRDVVWALDSRKDKYENLIDRMHAYATDNLNRKKIDAFFEVSIPNKREFLNPNIRKQLYLIFKEALTNILKHSDGNQVEIQLKRRAEEFKMVIHDNGSNKGVSKSDGMGLSSMAKRAADIGGEYEFVYNNGYRISVSVPID